MKIGLIGLGAIGREMLRYIDAAGMDIDVVGVLVANPAKHADAPWKIFDDPETFLATAPDLVVECASQKAFAERVPMMLSAGRDVIAGSVGALADERVHAAIDAAARDGGAQLFIPAGALAGIDALAAAKAVGISTVSYTRSAPPATWSGHEAVQRIDLAALTAAHLVFEGTARLAVQRFPKNANVAAVIALAGIGFEQTKVRIFADPAASSNVHTIDAEGRFGRLHTEIAASRISATTTSSRIVAGSLARGVMCRTQRIAV